MNKAAKQNALESASKELTRWSFPEAYKRWPGLTDAAFKMLCEVFTELDRVPRVTSINLTRLAERFGKQHTSASRAVKNWQSCGIGERVDGRTGPNGGILFRFYDYRDAARDNDVSLSTDQLDFPFMQLVDDDKPTLRFIEFTESEPRQGELNLNGHELTGVQIDAPPSATDLNGCDSDLNAHELTGVQIENAAAASETQSANDVPNEIGTNQSFGTGNAFHEMNEMTCHGGSEGLKDDFRNISLRINKIRDTGLNLALGSGTNLYMLFSWAAIVETNLFTVDGRIRRVSHERFKAIVTEARGADVPGKVITARITEEFGNAKIRWRQEAERIAKLIGYPFDALKVKCAPPLRFPEQTEAERAEQIYQRTAKELKRERKGQDLQDEIEHLARERIAAAGLANVMPDYLRNGDASR